MGQIDAIALRAMGDWLRDKDDSVVALLAATSMIRLLSLQHAVRKLLNAACIQEILFAVSAVLLAERVAEDRTQPWAEVKSSQRLRKH